MSSPTSSSSPYQAKLIVSESKSTLPSQLHRQIIQRCSESQSSGRTAFTIALSGGSLPSFLSGLSESFAASGVDPKFASWHVILADERCVPSTDADSNLKALKEKFLDGVPDIPVAQIYGIDEKILSDSDQDKATSDIARSYEENVVRPVLAKSGGKLDLAVLGFGPDGHTCSLFPGHKLLTETEMLVAPIVDSPKPPPCRITLTLPVLISMTRAVIFCGAGASKGPILGAVFGSKEVEFEAGKDKGTVVSYADPPPYPCGMVRPPPPMSGCATSVVWLVDKDAAMGLGE